MLTRERIIELATKHGLAASTSIEVSGGPITMMAANRVDGCVVAALLFDLLREAVTAAAADDRYQEGREAMRFEIDEFVQSEHMVGGKVDAAACIAVLGDYTSAKLPGER